MTRSFYVSFCIVYGLAITAGCSENTVSSENLPNNQIQAEINIVSNSADTVSAHAQLTTPDGINIILENGDELWFSVKPPTGPNGFSFASSDDVFASLDELQDTTTRFEYVPSISRTFEPFFAGVTGHWYSAELMASVQREYHVFLLRSDGRYLPSSVVLPQPVVITTPLSNTSYSRGNDDIVVEWTPPSAPLQPGESGLVDLEVHTDCPNGNEYTYSDVTNADSGSAVIAAGSLFNSLNEQNCAATIAIRRYRFGQLDNRFHSGTITGYQIGRVAIVSVP